MAVFPIPGEQVEVEVGDRVIATRVVDLVQRNVLVPCRGVLDLAVLDSEHVPGDVEHAIDDGLERKVLGDLVLVDPVVELALPVVVVHPVPGLDGVSVEVVVCKILEAGEFGDASLGETGGRSSRRDHPLRRGPPS